MTDERLTKQRDALVESLRRQDETTDRLRLENDRLKTALAAAEERAKALKGDLNIALLQRDSKRWSEPSLATARVNVTTTSYTVTGVLLAVFRTTAGKERVVVEFDQPKGLLHIHSPEQITIIEKQGD